MTPLEPSEAMEFSKHGLVNAGLIFFVLAITSTLVFGRFFCGWGCHVVALQDAARWLLGRLGLRPRAMRSRLLIWVPLFAFIYMFILPLLVRALLGRPLGVSDVHLTTDAFWSTFPGWLVGGSTLLICGFLVVYLLGSKGFCTYGCPYGGIFGLVDRFAPGRIRVTDACQHCGHCTAVCSSNVRVGEEVGTYGMVVDPGCMKCLDCVSVCPNDALYFGWGRPAAIAQPRTGESAAPPPVATEWRRSLLLFACFAVALFVLFGGVWDVVTNAAARGVLIALWISASLVCGRLAARGSSDYSLGEEVALAAAFLAVFGVVRGLYGVVPFLLSLGVAAIGAFLAVQTIRLAYAPSVKIQRWTLRKGGRVTPIGRGYCVLMAVVLLAWLHSAAVRTAAWQVDRGYASTRAIVPDLFAWVRDPGTRGTFDHAAAQRAIAWGEWLRRWAPADQDGSTAKLARVYAIQGRSDDSIRTYRQALASRAADSAARRDFAALLAAIGQAPEAVGVLTAGLNPDDDASRDSALQLGLVLAGDRRFDDAQLLFDESLAVWPNHPALLHNYAILETARSRPESAVALLQRAVAIDGELGSSRHLLGEILLAMERPDEALTHLDAAARLRPSDADVARLRGMALAAVNRLGEAEAELGRAVDLAPDRADLLLTLAGFYSMTGRADLAEQHVARAQALGR